MIPASADSLLLLAAAHGILDEQAAPSRRAVRKAYDHADNRPVCTDGRLRDTRVKRIDDEQAVPRSASSNGTDAGTRRTIGGWFAVGLALPVCLIESF